LPWGPPTLTLDEFRRRVVAMMPTSKEEEAFFQSLIGFWN